MQLKVEVILVLIVISYTSGIVVKSSQRQNIPYVVEIEEDYEDENPKNDVQVIDQFFVDSSPNWRSYLTTMDFKNAWGKGKSFLSSIFERVNRGLNNSFPDLRENILDTIKSTNIKAIYVGTLWCGDGTKARETREVGYFYETDACCRAHDLCPMAIDSNDSKYNLTNTGHFTKSHCDCDFKFYQCLKSASSLISKQIGYIFFNILGPQCFREEHPIVKCSKKVRGRCYTYIVDDQKPKINQWFDNKRF